MPKVTIVLRDNQGQTLGHITKEFPHGFHLVPKIRIDGGETFIVYQLKRISKPEVVPLGKPGDKDVRRR